MPLQIFYEAFRQTFRNFAHKSSSITGYVFLLPISFYNNPGFYNVDKMSIFLKISCIVTGGLILEGNGRLCLTTPILITLNRDFQHLTFTRGI